MDIFYHKTEDVKFLSFFLGRNSGHYLTINVRSVHSFFLLKVDAAMPIFFFFRYFQVSIHKKRTLLYYPY